jgi:hypothetical protein
MFRNLGILRGLEKDSARVKKKGWGIDLVILARMLRNRIYIKRPELRKTTQQLISRENP